MPIQGVSLSLTSWLQKKTRTWLPIAQMIPTAFATPGLNSSYPGSSYPGLISSFQFVAGFMNFFREVAIPATLCCFCEIETETRDCSSPGSHMSSPAASTLPALIMSGDLNWDRMYRLPRLAVRSRRCAVLCFRRVVVRRSYCLTSIRRCRRSPEHQRAFPVLEQRRSAVPRRAHTRRPAPVGRSLRAWDCSDYRTAAGRELVEDEGPQIWWARAAGDCSRRPRSPGASRCRILC